MTGARVATVVWVCAWIAIVLVPLTGAVVPGPAGAHVPPSLHGAFSLAATTMAWSLGIAVVATVLAIPAARLVTSLGPGRAGSLLAVLCLPLLLPPWALFYAWWASWPPDGPIFAAAASRDLVGFMRQATLGIAMITVTWPLATCCLVPSCARWTRSRRELLALDGTPWWRRQAARLRVESSGLGVAVAVGALLVASCTTAFDLAGVYTVANELRARADLGASALKLTALAWPVIPPVIAGAALLWWWVGRDPVEAPDRVPATTTSRVLVAIEWCLLVAAPLLALVLVCRWAPGNAFVERGGAVLASLFRAIIVGGAAAALVILAVGAMRGRRAGVIVRVMGVTWIAGGLLPLPLTASMVASGWTWIPGGRVVMLTTSAAWMMGLLIRGGAMAMLAARWAVRSEPRSTRDLRALDGVPWWRPSPTTRWAALATGLIVLAASMADVAMVGRLAPPMAEPPLATTLLNAIHYQRPETVTQVLLLLVLLAGISAIALACALRVRGRALTSLMCLALLVSVPACSDGSPVDEGIAPVPSVNVVGLPGRVPGRLDVPRGIATGSDGSVYVVDKSARVQRFDIDGQVRAWWTMPAFDNGMPVGMEVAHDGRIVVADTHEHRLAIFDPSGTLVETSGGYGEGPGEFIYPTDVIIDPSDEVYVAEYGGNDRVQVFDSTGQVVRTLGGPGDAPGEFRRPQSLAFSPDATVLWVADSGNHRVQGLDPVTGEVVAIIGEDWLRHPYGVATLPDSTIVVTEFGAHRLSRWGSDGTRLGAWGGWGTGPGRLRMPWGVCFDPFSDTVRVLDTGNARIMTVPRQALGPTSAASSSPSLPVAPRQEPPR